MAVLAEGKEKILGCADQEWEGDPSLPLSRLIVKTPQAVVPKKNVRRGPHFLPNILNSQSRGETRGDGGKILRLIFLPARDVLRMLRAGRQRPDSVGFLPGRLGLPDPGWSQPSSPNLAQGSVPGGFRRARQEFSAHSSCKHPRAGAARGYRHFWLT